MTYLASKASLRKQAARLVGVHGGEARKRADASICEAVRTLPAYGAARQVFGYVALSDEVCLAGLFECVDADGKRLYLPVMHDDESMEFRRWIPGEPLVAGAFGVQVPAQGAAPSEQRSLSLIPGRAFDGHGYRVGRGRGCYDRVLRELGRLGPTVGVAYACQVFASVPRERHDVPVDLVLTEQGVTQRRWPSDARRDEEQEDG